MTDNRLFELIYRSSMTDATVIFLNEGGACAGLRPSKIATVEHPRIFTVFYFFCTEN
jgi:hypothetical protein